MSRFARRLPFVERILATQDKWKSWSIAALKAWAIMSAIVVVALIVAGLCLGAAVLTTGAVHYWFVADAPFGASVRLNMNLSPMLTEPWRWRQHSEHLVTLFPPHHQQQSPGHSAIDVTTTEEVNPSKNAALVSPGVADMRDGVVQMLREKAATHLLATGNVKLLPKHEWSTRHQLNTNDVDDDDFFFTPMSFSFSGEAEYDIRLRLKLPVTDANLAIGPLTATLHLIGDRATAKTNDEGAASREEPRGRQVLVEVSSSASLSARWWPIRWFRHMLLVAPFTLFGYAAHDSEEVSFALIERFNPPMGVLRRIRGINVTLHASLAAQTPLLELTAAHLDIDVTTSGLTYYFKRYPLLVDAIFVGLFFCFNCGVAFVVLVGGGAYLYATALSGSANDEHRRQSHFELRQTPISAVPTARSASSASSGSSSRSTTGAGRPVRTVSFSDTPNKTAATTSGSGSGSSPERSGLRRRRPTAAGEGGARLASASPATQQLWQWPPPVSNQPREEELAGPGAADSVRASPLPTIPSVATSSSSDASDRDTPPAAHAE